MAEQKDPLVLTCIDGSRYSGAVCDYAAWIASRASAPVKLLHNIERVTTPAVADLSGSIGLGSQEELLEELTSLEQKRSKLLLEQGRQMLDSARERAVTAGAERVVTCQRHGSLIESLVELEDHIRVLVLGIRGEEHGESNKGLGAQLESIVRSLHKPILVVNREFKVPHSIMLAYDGSESARKALDMVATSPVFKGVDCHLVYVGDDGESVLSEGAEALSNGGIYVTSANLEGRTVASLVTYQQEHNIDLTVMGAFSHSKLRDLLLGSVTAKMLLETNQPLLLLR
ncbi:universal stress protein [Microbulbifer elongatus]|uniref:Universal stress protein n=1 Tax=Microbulbifer elongatus TaxID=86173 RepID=A0ABT1NW73_9GAMM|nr:universal stress protein [Microbulbifer elongatus]MCQ3828145.1 universal stress protein [Microbulbifer elongatus]